MSISSWDWSCICWSLKFASIVSHTFSAGWLIGICPFKKFFTCVCVSIFCLTTVNCWFKFWICAKSWEAMLSWREKFSQVVFLRLEPIIKYPIFSKMAGRGCGMKKKNITMNQLSIGLSWNTSKEFSIRAPISEIQTPSHLRFALWAKPGLLSSFLGGLSLHLNHLLS